MLGVIISIITSIEFIVALVPIVAGTAWATYNAFCPGLRLLTKRDYSSIKYVVYLLISWICAVVLTLAVITYFGDGNPAVRKVYFIVGAVSLTLEVFTFIVWMPKWNITSLILGLLPIASGIGIGIGASLSNQIYINIFGAMFLLSELAGLICYDEISVIHKHEYALLKLTDGDLIKCKCRTMKFHGFRQIIEICDKDEETILIPYSQIVKIKYEGGNDKVNNENSLKLLICSHSRKQKQKLHR